MEIAQKDRYSICKVSENTFTLTDADTLQTWEIEILRNSAQNCDDAQIKPSRAS